MYYLGADWTGTGELPSNAIPTYTGASLVPMLFLHVPELATIVMILTRESFVSALFPHVPVQIQVQIQVYIEAWFQNIGVKALILPIR